MLIDTHCHFDYYNEEEVDYALKKLRENNFKAIVVGTGDNNSKVKKLWESNKDVLMPGYGIYPSPKVRKVLWKNEENVLKFIKNNNPKLIGEVGLDKTYNNFDKQKEVFKKVIQISNELNVPMSIHTRKAEKEVIKMLKKNAKRSSILHCFSGNMNLVKEALKLGHYFSIPTNVLRSDHFKRIVKLIDDDKILLETDSPFLSSDKTKNFPHRIKESIPVIEKIKQKPMKKVIINNTKRIFSN